MVSGMHRAIGVATAIGVMISADVARGEPSIAPATDGIGTTVQQQGDRYDIGGGTRAGNNLFHSFQRLGLSSQEIANFLATPDLNAIVGRVTGGNPSVIDGLIRVSGGNPNLYLMNPAGIVFGAGARLDVPASFAATTATSLGFSDGGWFPATGAVDFSGLGGSLSWLEFASLRPGSLVNAGQLSVPAGQSLWLISGDTTLSTGTLRSPGGNVVVTAVPGTNRLRIAPDGSTLSLEVIPPNPESMTGRSLPELLAGGQLSSASQLVANPDGSVSLRSPDGSVSLPDRATVVAGTVDVSSTTGQGGRVTIAGDRVGLLGATIGADGATGGGQIQIGGSERGNGAVFAARTTLFDRFSQVTANATGIGDGGRIAVWADGLTWFGGSIAARGGPLGGNGGFAEVSGKQDLAVRGTADLSAPQGAIGTLLLDPRDIIIAATPTSAQDGQLSSGVPLGQAEGQILSADVDTLSASLDFTISESSLERLSSSASIVLEAQRDILLQNLPDNTLDLPTSNGSSVRFQAGRNIQAADTTDLLSTRGGSLTLQAGESLAIGPVSTSGGAIFLTTADSATTGNLNTAGGNLTITAGSNLTTGTLTSGGGNLTITSNNGAIVASAIQASSPQAGGAITLNGSTGVTVNGNLEAISSNGSGGGINITSFGPIALNGSLSTTATVGRGGDVTVTSNGNSINITGSIATNGNNGGNITLSAVQSIIVGGLTANGTSDTAGNVTLTSQLSTLTTGNINATGSNQGGTLQARSGNGMTLGTIDLSSSTKDGGNATLGITGTGDIQINSLNTQGGTNGIGGSVAITATRFFRAIGTFIDRTGQVVSIATSGGNGSNRVAISHGGSNQNPNVPLVVGEVPSSNGNGIAGRINTSNGTIVTGSFSESFNQGNIQLSTSSLPSPEPAPATTLITSPEPDPAPITSPEPAPTPITSPEPAPAPITSPEPPPTPTPIISPEPPPTPTPSPTPNLGDLGRIIQLGAVKAAQNDGLSLTESEYRSRQAIMRYLDRGRLDLAIIELDRLYTTLTNDHLGRVLSGELVDLPSLQANLTQLQNQTGLKPAVLYTFARSEQLDVVLVLPDAPPIYRPVREASGQRVTDTVNDLRNSITSSVAYLTNSYRQPAEQLYRWIVGPIAEDLVKNQVDTIIFSMDGGMRSLPVSVLHSGQAFLIERYSVGLIPSAALTDTQFTPINEAPVLSFGVSEFSDMPPLPAVPIELATINRLITEDRAFLNEEFNLENLKRQRRANPFPVLHFATHADFRPGAPSNSFVRLWDRRLAITELRSLGLSDPPVELLVLSACRTAIGDTTAELGFAGLAVETGVESVLASLWSVSDEGTLGLMASFYDALRSAPTKAEALRRAQLAMLRGTTRAENGLLVFPGGTTPLPAQLGEFANFSLSHPYYWASFTVIGSPW